MRRLLHRALLCFFLAGCSSQPFPALPDACADVPNRSRSGALELALDEPTLVPSGDVWYTYPTPGDYVLELDAMPPYGSLRLAVYGDAFAPESAFSTDVYDPQLRYTFTASIRFYLNVTLLPVERTCSPYTLTLRRVR